MAGLFVFDVTRYGQDAGILRLRTFLHALAHHPAVRVGQVDVKDYELRVVLNDHCPGVKPRGCHKYFILIVTRQGRRDNVKIVRIVVNRKNATLAFLEPIQRNAVADHELSKAFIRDPAIAAGTQPVSFYLSKIKPSGYGVSGDPAYLGHLAARKDFFLHRTTLGHVGRVLPQILTKTSRNLKIIDLTSCASTPRRGFSGSSGKKPLAGYTAFSYSSLPDSIEFVNCYLSIIPYITSGLSHQGADRERIFSGNALDFLGMEAGVRRAPG